MEMGGSSSSSPEIGFQTGGLQKAEADANKYTGDGSVDYKSRPAVRSKTGTWRAAPFLLVMICLDFMGNLSIVLNLPIYLTRNLSMAAPQAAQASNNMMGAANLCPLLGGFLADAYIGRFWGTIVFAVVQILGTAFLTTAAGVKSQSPSKGSGHPTTGQLALNFTALYTIAVGTGGMRPCISTMGADQFDEEDPREKKLLSTYFNLSFFVLLSGVMIAVTLLLWVQDQVSFGVGYLVAGLLLVLGLSVVVAGYPFYRYHIPTGSPLTRIARVFTAAFFNRKLSDGELIHIPPSTNLKGRGKLELLPHTDQMKWMDRAAMRNPANEEGSEKSFPSPWKLCTVTQVEEAKIFVRMLPIMLTTVVLNAIAAQFTTWTVLQGLTMDRSLGRHFIIPPPSVGVLSLLVLLLAIPLYDRVFVPLARRFTGRTTGITPLQRTGAGLVLATLSMLIGGLVEVRRLSEARHHNLLDVDPTKPENAIPMRIFWLVPMQVTFGLAEFLAIVGLNEFFYSQAPQSMRTLALGISASTAGLGYYLSSALIDTVNYFTQKFGKSKWLNDNINHGHVDYFYFLLCGLGAINFLLFLVASDSYTYRADKSYKDPEEAETDDDSSIRVESTWTKANQVSPHRLTPPEDDDSQQAESALQLQAPAAAQTNSPARPRTVFPPRTETSLGDDLSSPPSKQGFPIRLSPGRSPNLRGSPSLRSRLNEVVRSADMEFIPSPSRVSIEKDTGRQAEGLLASSPSQTGHGAASDRHLPGTGIATDSAAPRTNGDEDSTESTTNSSLVTRLRVTRLRAPDVYSSDDESGSIRDFSFVSDHFERRKKSHICEKPFPQAQEEESHL